VDIDLGVSLSPAQEKVALSTARYKLIGGAMGGGKTLDLAIEAIDLLVSYPGNIGFMGRNDLQDLLKTTLKEFLARLPRELLIQHHQTQQWVDIESTDPRYPSRLYYGELKDPDSLLSMNLGFFIIDEAFEVGHYAFTNLASRLRHKLPDGTYPFFCGLLGTNPHPCWLMDYFPVLEEDRLAYERAYAQNPRFAPFPRPSSPTNTRYPIRPQYAYFPMTMFDNPFLPPGYVEEQESVFADNPTMYDRMVKGVWTGILTGLVYQLQRYHRWTRQLPNERLWRPGLPVELAIDPSGGSAPYAINVIQQVGPYVCIVDEFYQEGASDEDAMDWLKAKPFGNRTNIADCIIDPAARNSINKWQQHGFPARGLTRAKDIKGQILGVRGLLRRNPASGYASLLVDEDYCPHLINEFGLYSYAKLNDTKRAEGDRSPEKPEDKHNHLLNALEYWTLEKRVVADGGGQQRKKPTRIPAAYESMLAEV
jgi:hypothetical protein